MLVIENPSSSLNPGERSFIAHQRGKKGIALLNFMVGGGGPRKPGREVDAIMILPHGIFSVEVKHTNAVGALSAPLNDSWSIGAISSPFSSTSRTPSAQADQAAKILASHLASKAWPKGYITPVVAISGKVTVPGNIAWVGTVGVCTVEHFDLVVKKSKSKRIQARHVGPMLERLGVSTSRVPTMERLLDEGFAPTPAEVDSSASPQEAPTATAERPSNPTPAPRPTPAGPVPSPLALARRLERAPEPAPDDETPVDAPEEPEPELHAEPYVEPDVDEPESSPGPRARLRRWLTEPLGKDRATTARTGALTSVIVLLGVWQLMAGHLFMSLIGPEVGRYYFIYGTWQNGWTSVADSGVPGWSAFTAPLVGAVLVIQFCIAQWLRINVGSATRTEIGAYWVSIFVLIIASPALFSTLGWTGVWLMWLAYTVVWPLTAIVANEIRKSALFTDPDTVWKEYEI